jgi:predicted acetyltransferase
MTTILQFETLGEFFDYNETEFEDNYFVYYHFLQILELVKVGEMTIHDAYNIIDDSNGNFAICIWLTGNYFVYSNSWTEEIIEKLAEKIDLPKFNDFVFMGQRDLILELFKKFDVKYELIKDRLIYECSKVNETEKKISDGIQNASPNDYSELLNMSFDNYVEEYDGKGLKVKEDFVPGIISGMEENSIYIIKNDEKEICSMLQKINSSDNNPMIGNLFTKKSMRNKGYAFSLLYIVTQGLLKNGFKKCGLLSDVKNISSNKVFISAGYVPVYKWISIITV